MYYLKIGNTYHPFIHESDALIAQLILRMSMENKFSDEEILHSKVEKNDNFHLRGKEILNAFWGGQVENGDA